VASGYTRRRSPGSGGTHGTQSPQGKETGAFDAAPGLVGTAEAGDETYLTAWGAAVNTGHLAGRNLLPEICCAPSGSSLSHRVNRVPSTCCSKASLC
jgi:hypothetical protein